MKRWSIVILLPLLQLLLLLTTGLGSVGRAEDLTGVSESASADLKKAVAELTQAREVVEAERVPLARKLADLEKRLEERRGELARAQRAQENQLVELNALKTDSKRLGEEVKYVESLGREYARAFRARLTFVEEPRYRAMFDAADKATSAPDLSPAERFSRGSALLVGALDRSEAALGGEIIDGRALDKQGRVLSGKVALIGPVAVFAASTSPLAGILQQELNKADPTVVGMEGGIDAGCRTLATTGTGNLAFDPTLGNAFKLALLKEGLYEKLSKGGLIMIPLLGLGAAALLVGLFKWIQLLRIRPATEADLQEVLQHLEGRRLEKALARARGIPGMAGDLLAAAVEHSRERKEYIEEILYEKMLGARAKLERGLAFLALSATTGPLMGLLGTVMGMIATFKLISSFGSGDPKQLAAGISEALICTATGMGVAIPSLLLHAFLSRKAKGIIGGMEQIAVGFVNGVPETPEAVMTASDFKRTAIS